MAHRVSLVNQATTAEITDLAVALLHSYDEQAIGLVMRSMDINAQNRLVAYRRAVKAGLFTDNIEKKGN